MSYRSRRGDSLIELIVALMILELSGAAALAAAFTAERLGRHAARGAAEDVARWQQYRRSETLASCVNAPVPDSIPLVFPETADRPDLATVLRCGR